MQNFKKNRHTMTRLLNFSVNWKKKIQKLNKTALLRIFGYLRYCCEKCQKEQKYFFGQKLTMHVVQWMKRTNLFQMFVALERMLKHHMKHIDWKFFRYWDARMMSDSSLNFQRNLKTEFSQIVWITKTYWNSSQSIGFANRNILKMCLL